MTRKHFEAIASTIANLPNLTDLQREQLARAMADTVGQYNDYFDYARFLKACGVEA